MEIKKQHKLNCHCGAVVASVLLKDLKILKGEDKLSLYQFNTMAAKHFFCSVCGIYTHHQRRSKPTEYGFNVACLEGVNPFELKDVPVMDGGRRQRSK